MNAEQTKWKAGDSALAWDNSSGKVEWRECVLISESAPSKAGPGFYVQWTKLPERIPGGPLPSSSGWKPLNCLRPIPTLTHPTTEPK